MSSSKLVIMKGFSRWAKLSEETMDTYEKHFDQTGGRFMMDFYPADDAELQKFWDSGVGEESMGNPRLRDPSANNYGDGDQDLGIGSYLRLKRDNNHKVPAFGGPPLVFDFTEGEGDRKKKWDFAEKGMIWNGAEVSVKLSIYGAGATASIRIEAVAVYENGPEPESSNENEGDPTF